MYEIFSSLQLNFCNFGEVAIVSIHLPQRCMGEHELIFHKLQISAYMEVN